MSVSEVSSETKKSNASRGIFYTVVKYLYRDPIFTNSLTTEEAISLYGYYMQATIGPNVDARPSCLLFVFSSGIEDQKWQFWKNLGNMTKSDAATKFLGQIMHINPDFMNYVVEPQKLSIRGMIQYEAAMKIQGLLRKVRAKKYLVQLIAKVRASDLQEFLDMLQKGIKVMKLRSDGSVMRKRFLALKMGSSLADSRLFTFASGYSRDATSKGTYLVDIADVQLGAHSFHFRPIASSLNSEECMSIISSERTFDIQVLILYCTVIYTDIYICIHVYIYPRLMSVLSLNSL
jgi:acyl-CoA-binding protein